MCEAGWGRGTGTGWGQSKGSPCSPLPTPQRFQKAAQPLRSWRTATTREAPQDVIVVPFTITLTDSNFTTPPYSSSET